MGIHTQVSGCTFYSFISLLFIPMPKAKETQIKFQRHDGDTWSPEVQIAWLSTEITQLQEHLATHHKDFDAKRSLLKKVARRRTFLKYLKQTNLDAYTKVSNELWMKV